MVARKVTIKEPFKDEIVAEYEVGQEGVEFIAFSNGKLVLRGKLEDGQKVSTAIPVGEMQVTTVSDGKGVPEEYQRAKRPAGQTQKAF